MFMEQGKQTLFRALLPNCPQNFILSSLTYNSTAVLLATHLYWLFLTNSAVFTETFSFLAHEIEPK